MTFFSVLLLGFQHGGYGIFTPLEIDNHPCQPEKLKVCTQSNCFKTFVYLPSHFGIFLFNKILKILES